MIQIGGGGTCFLCRVMSRMRIRVRVRLEPFGADVAGQLPVWREYRLYTRDENETARHNALCLHSPFAALHVPMIPYILRPVESHARCARVAMLARSIVGLTMLLFRAIPHVTLRLPPQSALPILVFFYLDM